MTEYSDQQLEAVRQLAIRCTDLIRSWGEQAEREDPKLTEVQIRAAVTLFAAGWIIAQANETGTSVMHMFRTLDYDARRVRQA